MISILASGTLISDPSERVSKAGNKFVTAQIRSGDGSESHLISLVAFDEDICKSLRALSRGDAVVVSGSAKPTSWTGRGGELVVGLDVVVKVVLTHYALTKRRKGSSEVTGYGLPAESPVSKEAAREAGDDRAPF